MVWQHGTRAEPDWEWDLGMPSVPVTVKQRLRSLQLSLLAPLEATKPFGRHRPSAVCEAPTAVRELQQQNCKINISVLNVLRKILF